MKVFRLIVAELTILFLIPLKGYSQSTGIYTDLRGNKYAAINSRGMLQCKEEDRSESPTFRCYIQLYEYTSTGQNTKPIKETDGKDIYVYRTTRHTERKTNGGCDWKVSKHFIISPDIVNSDGETKAATMDWATANGYLATARTNDYSVPSFAVPKGCAMYRGKNNQDEQGTWRVPTRGECALILMFYKKMEGTQAETDFKPFALPTLTSTIYWSATEKGGGTSDAWLMEFFPDDHIKGYNLRSISKKNTYYLRCIRDIPQ